MLIKKKINLLAPRLCKCGCGQEVRSGNVYVFNHHARGRHFSEEAIRKMSQSHKGRPTWIKGKHLSEETKQKLREANLGKHLSEETRRKMGLSHKGHVMSEYNRQKLRIAHLGKPMSDETKQKLRESHLGKPLSPEHRKKLSEVLRGRVFSEEHKRRISESNKGKKQSKESRRKISKARKGYRIPLDVRKRMSQTHKQMWRNKEYSRATRKRLMVASHTGINRPERKLRHILNDMFPGEYRYVGDGKVWINGKNPDFINVNGQKKIIELFGDYWHGKERTGRITEQEESYRTKHFKKFGYKTLIIWQGEMSNLPAIRAVVRSFHMENKT